MIPVLFHLIGVAGSIVALHLGFNGLAFGIILSSAAWTVLTLSHYLKK